MSTITVETASEQFMATITDGLDSKKLTRAKHVVGTPYNTPVTISIEDNYCSGCIPAIITKAERQPGNPNKYDVEFSGTGPCQGIHIKGEYDDELRRGQVVVTHLS